MSVSASQIAVDTFKRGFAWCSFETLISSGKSDFDLSSRLTQDGIYYASQGITRFIISRFGILDRFSPSTQRVMVYAVSFFVTTSVATPLMSLLGRQVAWQDVARRAAASTAFWYICNPQNEFTSVKL